MSSFVGAGIATYTPSGGELNEFVKTPPYEQIFFGNLNCSSSDVSSAPSGVGASGTCSAASVSVANPTNGGSSIFSTVPVKGDTTLSIKNNLRSGYKAQLSIASCTPAGATAGFSAAASTVNM